MAKNPEKKPPEEKIATNPKTGETSLHPKVLAVIEEQRRSFENSKVLLGYGRGFFTALTAVVENINALPKRKRLGTADLLLTILTSAKIDFNVVQDIGMVKPEAKKQLSQNAITLAMGIAETVRKALSMHSAKKPKEETPKSRIQHFNATDPEHRKVVLEHVKGSLQKLIEAIPESKKHHYLTDWEINKLKHFDCHHGVFLSRYNLLRTFIQLHVLLSKKNEKYGFDFDTPVVAQILSGEQDKEILRIVQQFAKAKCRKTY